VGFFMFYASAGLLGLLPRQFWDDLTVFGRALWNRVGFRRVTPPRAFGAGLLPERSAGVPPVILRPASPLRLVLTGAAAFVMVCFMAVTLATGLEGMKAIRLTYPPPSWTVIRGLNIYQNWGLFTHPTPTASWYVSKAQLADGSWVDILQAGAPVEWTRQSAPNALYRANSKWRVAMAKIGSLDEEEGLLEQTGYTLARYWNDHHPPEQAVAALTVYSFSQPLPIRGDSGRRWRIWLEWPEPVAEAGVGE
jgi:hypothetical protein